MLADDIESPEALTPAELTRRYVAAVAAAVEVAGRDRVQRTADLDDEALDALRSGDGSELTVADAAAVLALTDGSHDASSVIEAVRDRLLFDMSMAILDVEALAADLDGALDLDPQEIQRRVEGRTPMTLEEYAHIRLRIARELQ